MSGITRVKFGCAKSPRGRMMIARILGTIGPVHMSHARQRSWWALLFGSCELSISVMVAPKYGKQRLWFSLIDFYSALILETYRGQPSKWVYSQRKSWEASFQEWLSHSFVCFVFPKQCCTMGILARVVCFVCSCMGCEFARLENVVWLCV